MKPDWKDAPDWANYLAMDAGGIWRWHRKEPKPLRFWWSGTTSTSFAKWCDPVSDWEKTLEGRPDAKE